jgi:hypothetical protein
MLPDLAYLAACYFSGYRFKRRHYISAVLGTVAFFSFISPFELYSRGFLGLHTFREKVYLGFHVLETMPTWASQVEEVRGDNYRFSYYSRPGTGELSRFSVINFDSNMISACSNGFHYGWTTLKIDLLQAIPYFLYKNKPQEDSAAFTGRVTGLNPDADENAEIAESPIADAFGWWGVVLFAFFALPLLFVIVESMFDMTKPWGMVALGFFFMKFGEGNMGMFIGSMIRIPIQVLLISYLVVGIVQIVPVRGDH